MFDRINLNAIFKKHFETFYSYGEANLNGKKKIRRQDKLVFLILPTCLALISVFLGIRLTNDYINIIITSLSIFVGLLLNLLLLIFDLAKKQKQKISEYGNMNEIVPNIESVKFTIAKELYTNISFAIAISIISILACFLSNIRPTVIISILVQFPFYSWIKQIYVFTFTTIALASSIEFLLTLLMILKRFFLIFNKEIND